MFHFHLYKIIGFVKFEINLLRDLKIQKGMVILNFF